ncbi:hypothetical protein DPX16_8182 [Anabarilius grahami]|uniref:SWIM-type domain-containing protein n=1 Tax=Anabarilius grahami TaxID=495550 RepID=A0A3N0Y7W8_ANAGA|nr:hypothetical protein DPX16_8182 [Anabarilius grahami]
MMMAVVTEVTVQLRMKKRRNIFQFAKIQSEYIETILLSLPQKNLRKTLFLFSHSSPSSSSATLLERVFYTAEDTVVLKHSKPLELLAYQCSCVAGLALCNHIAALLFQTAHYSQQGATAVPPTHSCTGSELQWHKPRTQGFKPGPTTEMVRLSARPKERRLAEGIRSNLYKAACNLTCGLPDMSVLRVNDIY